MSKPRLPRDLRFADGGEEPLDATIDPARVRSEHVEVIERAVEQGLVPNKSAAIRDAVKTKAAELREQLDEEVRADGGVPVGTPPLHLGGTRTVAITLHRVRTRGRGDDQYHVAFADETCYELDAPAHGSTAEWVESKVLRCAPEHRFASLTPECDREADAPTVGRLHVRDGRVAGLALDVDALLGAEAEPPRDTHGQVESSKNSSGTPTQDTVDGVKTNGGRRTLAHDCPKWPDGVTVHVPRGETCEACGWRAPDADDDPDRPLATDGGNVHARDVNSIVREQKRVADSNDTLPDYIDAPDGGDA